MNSPFAHELRGYAYAPIGQIQAISTPLTPIIEELMQESLEQAEIALQNGGTPVGAALVDIETGQQWSDFSDDTVTGDLQGHAEIKCYRQAQPIIGNRLGQCALISTTELCPMCVSTFAQGNISTIIVAAPRSALVREDGTPILRRRKINMGHILTDSAAHTNAYTGYRADESVALWQRWDRSRRS